MSSDTTHDLIAVEQYGYCIFGIGETVEEAKADAAQWLGPDDREQLGEADWNVRPVSGEMRLARVTPALAAQVREQGGHLDYGARHDGTLCTLAEEQADNGHQPTL